MTVLGPNCISVAGDLWRLQRWMREDYGYGPHDYIAVRISEHRGGLEVYPQDGDLYEWHINGRFLNDDPDDDYVDSETYLQEIIEGVIHDIIGHAEATVWKDMQDGNNRGSAMIGTQEVSLHIQGCPPVRVVAGMAGQKRIRRLQGAMKEQGIPQIRIAYTGMNGCERIELSEIAGRNFGQFDLPSRDLEIDGMDIEDFAEQLALDVLDGNFNRWKEYGGRVGHITITPDKAELEMSSRSAEEVEEEIDLEEDTRTAGIVQAIKTMMAEHDLQQIAIRLCTYSDGHTGLWMSSIIGKDGQKREPSKEGFDELFRSSCRAVIDAVHPEWGGVTEGEVSLDISPDGASMKVESYDQDERGAAFTIDITPPPFLETPQTDSLPTP